MRNISNYIKTFVLLGVVLFFSSCNQGIGKFENKENFIYFNLPFKVNAGVQTSERIDSILYSFSLEELGYTKHEIKIPVNTIGLAQDEDRSYKVEVVAEKTTATDADWDKSSIANCIVKKGSIDDTLRVVLLRSAALQEGEKVLTLRLVATDDFTLGIPKLLTVQINFSDILNKPDWWNTPAMVNYVGSTYYREVYIKWMEIYYLGADPNLETHYNAGNRIGTPLWWGNMPFDLTSIRWFKSRYPSTIMFLGLLKKHFDENIVYPDGDATKPRIQLPIPA